MFKIYQIFYILCTQIVLIMKYLHKLVKRASMLYKNIYYTNKDSNCISRMSMKQNRKEIL